MFFGLTVLTIHVYRLTSVCNCIKYISISLKASPSSNVVVVVVAVTSSNVNEQIKFLYDTIMLLYSYASQSNMLSMAPTKHIYYIVKNHFWSTFS